MVFVHHHTPTSRWFPYSIANGGFCTPLPTTNGGFRTPLHTSLTAVFVHHCLPAQRWFFCTVTHLPNAVFVHHHPPTPRWFSYTIAHPSHGPPSPPAQRWFSCAITHPSIGNFRTPLTSISQCFLYSISHPPLGGFRTPPRTHPGAVFVHHYAPSSRPLDFTCCDIDPAILGPSFFFDGCAENSPRVSSKYLALHAPRRLSNRAER